VASRSRAVAAVGRVERVSFVLFALGIAASTDCAAHSGGLDAYGCHHNRKQGGYHCHRGEMAGQSFASQQQMLDQLRGGPSGQEPAPTDRQ